MDTTPDSRQNNAARHNGRAPDPQAAAPMSSYRNGGGRGATSANGDGSGSGKRTYGDLLRSGAGRRLAAPVAIIVAAGVAGYVLTSNWRTAATAAGIALVAYLVYSARRRSEIPQWRRPSAAQRRTEAQLRPMKRFGYKVLHARAIPGGNGVIDHFVVGRRGAFAIDSETWDKRLPVRDKLEKLYHGKFPKNKRLDEALEEAQIAQRLVSEALGKDIFVRPSLVIYGPSMPWDIHRLRGIDVISGNRIRKWLRTGKDRLTEREIDRIYEAAQKVLPPRY